MNVILACTAVYGVFAPYTAGGHEILDVQRNSSCDPCPSPPSSPLSSPPPIPARPESGGKRVIETRNRISLTYFFKWIIRAWLIRFRVSETSFPPDSGREGIGGGDERGDGHGSQLEFRWNSAGIPWPLAV